MGRRQEQLTGDGPVLRFAGSLRELRGSTGMTLRQLAERAGYAHTTLAAAERGRLLPTWPVVEAFVQGSGASPGEWRESWQAAAREEDLSGWSSAPLSGAGLRTPLLPAQLPRDVPGFTGRAAELSQFHAMLTAGDPGALCSTAVCTIEGMAGIGKTALAVHCACQVAERYPDGQLYADLRGFDPDHRPLSSHAALELLLQGLGVDDAQIPEGTAQRAGLYRSVLAGRRVLIMLDNAATSRQVRPLLPGGGGCLVIVTSRTRLGGLVARDGARRITLGLPGPADAAAMLARVVGAERVDAEPDAAAELVSLCGYLPLALRIAAEHAISRPYLALADAVAELAGTRWRLDLLGTAGDETTALRAVFSWSYQALDRQAARMFRLLGLHVGRDISVGAVAMLAGTTLQTARELLEVLTSAHLIQQCGQDRYRLHVLLRLYAAERAVAEDSSAEREQAAERLRDSQQLAERQRSHLKGTASESGAAVRSWVAS